MYVCIYIYRERERFIVIGFYTNINIITIIISISIIITSSIRGVRAARVRLVPRLRVCCLEWQYVLRLQITDI